MGDNEEGKAAQASAGGTSGASTTGCICVNSRPPGANIQFDCKDMQMKTPAILTDVAPGTHTIGVTLEGYSTVSRRVQVSAGSSPSVCLTIMTEENQKHIRNIVIWTIAFLAVSIGIAFLNRIDLFGNLFGVSDSLTKLIIYCACAGALGGATFSVYEIVCHLGVGDFDMDYDWWYILRPFIGLVYGTMILLLVAGGLMTLSTTQAPLSDNLFTQNTMMFYIALAFLAGYAEEPVSLQLKSIAEAVFKEPPRTDSQNEKTKKD